MASKEGKPPGGGKTNPPVQNQPPTATVKGVQVQPPQPEQKPTATATPAAVQAPVAAQAPAVAKGTTNGTTSNGTNGTQSPAPSGEAENEIWKYFKRDGQTCVCKMCHKAFKVDGSATIGLAVHLRNAHRIGLKRAADEVDPTIQTTPVSSRQGSSGSGSGGATTTPRIIFKDDDKSAMSPTKLSRLDEKNALVGLNNRLAVIVDRNRQLEAENSKLNNQLNTAEETLVVTTNKLKQTFERENGDTRKKLEDAEKEKAKLEMAKANLQKDLADTNNKLANRDKDLAQNQKQLKDADAKLANLAGDLKKAQDEKDKLAKDKKELGDENKDLKKGVDDLRKKLEAEVLAKVGLENALRNKNEELVLKSQVHQQEVAVMMSKKNNEVRAVGDQLEKQFQAKLAEEIRQLRKDCDDQIRTNKEDQDNLYDMKEDNLKKQLEKAKNAMKDKADELNAVNKKLADAEKKIIVLDSDKFNLQQNLKDVEKKWKDDQARADKEKKGLEKELEQMQDDKEGLINEYQDLMEVKLTLDNELAVYRKLLEGEEDRLNISFDKEKGKEKEKEQRKQPEKQAVAT